MRKIRIKELPWFQSVADVIGEGQAQIEISRVIHSDCFNSYSRYPDLFSAFNWTYSPQGGDFWSSIYCGVNPNQRA